MYMLSKLEILYKAVERAKRIEAYGDQLIMLKNVRTANDGKTLKDWQDAFAYEALRVYPKMVEFVEEVAKHNFALEDQVRELKIKILELEDQAKTK